ncbi:MAG: M43 family zinc metalloprotease [Bacteroidota bacterium]
MKTNYYKHILLGLLCITHITGVMAQEEKHCATTEAMEALYKAHPEMIQEAVEYEKAIQQQIENDKKSGNSRAADPVYIIPVVFHVIHTYGAENISDAQILDAINILNKDFRKLNADTSSIVAAFDTVAADSKIEFRLAKLDPNGNCTNGIDRIYSHKTNKGDDAAKLNPWPRSKYLNIWTVKTIDRVGAAAYAVFPSNSSYVIPYDGIITASDYVGSIGTGSTGRSRILTHEVGHFLNLYHIWGNTTVATVCGDDNVSDTPVTKGHDNVCNLTDQTCTPGVIENTQNYMDYSYCFRMFTKGQATRMRTALASSVGQRSSLWAASNLAATGTDGGTYSICAPRPDFYATRYDICEGSTVLFRQNIMNGTPSNPPVWSFPGGTPSASTVASPIITYSAPGLYTVKLTAANAAGTDSVVKVDLIRVSGPTAEFSGMYSETFEVTSEFASWQMIDWDKNSPKAWQATSSAGYNSGKSLLMNANGNYSSDVDELITPALDLTNITNPALTFRCAAASKATSAADLDDELNVYSSINCGQTWTLRTSFKGTNAATGFINNGFNSGNFVPTSASQWALKGITIPSTVATTNVRFKFEYITGSASNNVYIDNINIVSTVGINETALANANVSIYPNPSNESSTVFYSLKQQADVKITVFNVLGKIISEVNNDNQPEGDYSFLISKQELNLNNGVYFIKFSVDNSSVTQKLIITE